jgi:hypothetical protein
MILAKCKLLNMKSHFIKRSLYLSFCFIKNQSDKVFRVETRSYNKKYHNRNVLIFLFISLIKPICPESKQIFQGRKCVGFVGVPTCMMMVAECCSNNLWTTAVSVAGHGLVFEWRIA